MSPYDTMATAKKKCLCQIQTEDKQDLYLLTTLHADGEEGMDLMLSDGEKAWTGTVSEDDLDIMSGKVKMEFKEFVTQTRKALTRKNVGGFNFIYQVKSYGSTLELMWKKHMVAEKIKFQLGSTSLQAHPDSALVTRTMFSTAIETMTDLSGTITSLQSDNQRLSTERASALKRLEKCVHAKEEMESDLFAKFVTVVNDKKAKIRNLRDELEDARAGIPSTSQNGASVTPSTSVTASTSKKTAVERNSSDDESRTKVPADSDSEYDTDEEKVSPPPSKKGRQKVKSPTKLSPGQASLMLDDGAYAQDEAPVAGRRRRREPAVKKTPSKPVIPKASSQKSDVTPGRSSMRKSSTRSSNKSSDNIDMDLLMDDM